MSKSLLRTDKEIAEIYKRHSKTVYRVCFAYMKNPADTEDAVQDTFFQLIKSGPAFESEEHEKAWLIRTATNICKNVLRHWWRRHENIEDFYNLPSSENIETDDIFQVVMELPEKYKTVVYLYYYEGYSYKEISTILKIPISTVKMRIHYAKKKLKLLIEEDTKNDRE